MEKKKETIVAIDIGTTKICAVAGRLNEYGKLEILGIGKSLSKGVSRGMVANIDKTVESIKLAVEQLKSQVDIDFKKVYVGIAGEHIRCQQQRGNIVRNNTEDEISRKDIEEMIKQMKKMPVPQGNLIIHVLPQEFIVDGEHFIKDPEGYPGTNLEANFHIITGKATAAKNIQRCIVKSGLEVEDIILEPIASAEAVLSEEEKEAGVVLVDIGGGSTDITIFKENIIRYTAVIPFGGEIVTSDIQQGCKLLKEHAEKLKLKFGSSLPVESFENKVVSIPSLKGRPAKEISLKNLAGIINARMEEIIHDVLFHIETANKDYPKTLIGGIVLTGGGAMLKNVKPHFEYITGMDARIGLPNEHLAKSEVPNLQNPIYSTGIGLVLKGFEENKSELEEEESEETLKTTENETIEPNVVLKEKKGLAKFWKSIKKWFEDGIENDF
ncbi:MAG: cell division protein FtsA [Chitinophagaceae bacterium]|nr:MAG: cell division protein FtsA [Chitinophagaceae bacterium]